MSKVAYESNKYIVSILSITRAVLDGRLCLIFKVMNKTEKSSFFASIFFLFLSGFHLVFSLVFPISGIRASSSEGLRKRVFFHPSVIGKAISFWTIRMKALLIYQRSLHLEKILLP